MADEQEAIASSGLETATAAEVTTEPTIVDEPVAIPGPEEAIGDVEGLGTEGGVQEIETIEIDWDDGQKYRIPKALEAGLLKNKDYTTKTQEVSKKTKALEAREVEIEERFKVSEEYIEAKAGLKLLDQQLAEYAKLTPQDWDAHQVTNPAATERAWRQYQLLKEQRAEAANSLEKLEADRTGKADSDLKTRIQETLEHAKNSKTGLKPEAIPKLVEFAEQLGIPDETIKRNWSPIFADVLHYAQLGKQLVEKQATAPKLPNPTNVQPLKTVNGKTTPASNLDLAATDDMAAYVAARKRGVGGKPLR